MSRARSIIKNFFSLTTAEVINRILSVLVVAFLARRLGPEDFGTLNVAASLVNYFLIFADLGLILYGIKRIAQSQEPVNETISQVVSVRFLLSAASFTLLAAIAFLFIHPPLLRLLVILSGLVLFAQALSTAWAFQGTEKMEFSAGYSITQGMAYALLVFLCVRSDSDIYLVPLALLAAGLIADAVLFIAARRMYGPFRPRLDLHSSISAVRSSLLMGISWFLTTNANWNIPMTVMGFMSPATVETGLFSAAFKCIIVLIGFAMAMHAVLLPVIISLMAKNRDQLTIFMHGLEKIISVFIIPLIVGAVALSSPLIILVFGAAYTESAGLLSILIGSVYVFVLNILFFNLLVAAGKNHTNMIISSFHTGLLLVSTFVGIRLYGASGAAWAYLLSEMLTFAINIAAVSSFYRTRLYAYVACPALASGGMFIALRLMTDYNLFIQIGAGMAVYAVLLFAVRGVRLSDMTTVMHAVRNKTDMTTGV